MTLDELPKGTTATIRSISDDGPLKERLFSFGISRNAQVQVIAHSISKATVEIKIGATMLALRHDEAKKILVEEAAS